MKEGIHPEYNPVVFVDASTGDEIVTRAAMRGRETRTIDGVEHFVIPRDITSFSHPFYTGKQKLVDREGRVERFRRRYAKAQGK